MTPVLMDLVLEQQKRVWTEACRLVRCASQAPWLARPVDWRRGLATPYRVVYAIGPVRLLHFERQGPPVWAEPILICPAPIYGPEILDLAPRRSVVRHLLAAGLDAYLLDWGDALPLDRGTGLADLVNTNLKNTVQLIRQRSRMPHFHLMGYCLGGTLVTIFTALYPAVVKDLILLAAPIDASRDEGLLKAWAVQGGYGADELLNTFGNLSPSGFLPLLLALLDPAQKTYGVPAGLAAGLRDPEYLESLIALTRWAAARVHVPRGVYRDVVDWIYQRNMLAEGRLMLDDSPVRLKRVACSLLLLTATADRLVPPGSTLGLLPLAGSRDVVSMELEGGHETLAFGRKAHETFWPAAAQWIADHSTPRTGPWIRPGESASGRPQFDFNEQADPASTRFPQPTG